MRRLRLLAIVAVYVAGISSGWHLLRALDVPAISGPSYPDWQRRELSKEVYWLNYAANHKHAK